MELTLHTLLIYVDNVDWQFSYLALICYFFVKIVTAF